MLREGWSGVSNSTDTGDISKGQTTSASRPFTSGRHEVQGHMPVLTGAARREVPSLFAPGAGSDALPVIDGESYLRQD